MRCATGTRWTDAVQTQRLRIKLDENVPSSAWEILATAGHEPADSGSKRGAQIRDEFAEFRPVYDTGVPHDLWVKGEHGRVDESVAHLDGAGEGLGAVRDVEACGSTA